MNKCIYLTKDGKKLNQGQPFSYTQIDYVVVDGKNIAYLRPNTAPDPIIVGEVLGDGPCFSLVGRPGDYDLYVVSIDDVLKNNVMKQLRSN